MSPSISRIETREALEGLFQGSHHAPVVIFKHSVTCGISAHLLQEIGAVETDVNVIVVQSHRDLSNEIERRTGHRHQSPQAFVIRDGKAVYHASHYGIDPAAINAHLDGPQ